MSLIKMLKTMGLDTNNQVAIVQLINGLNLSNEKKKTMFGQFLQETNTTPDPAAIAAANFTDA